MTTLEIVTLTTASIGAVCGLIGATLGVINTWHQMSRNKVRVLVRPAHALPVGGGGPGDWTVSIEVLNLSTFPVTIDEVGLELHDKQHMLDMAARTTNRGGFPVRLDSRESLTILLPSSFLHDDRFAEIDKAYARCQCGTIRYGTSPALRQLVSKAAKRLQ